MPKKAKIEEETVAEEVRQAEAEVETPAKDEVSTQAADKSEPEAVETEKSDHKSTTKAGKRSAKAVREEAAEAERKQKAAAKTDEPKPKFQTKPNPEKAHGKKYRQAAKLVEADKIYDLGEAIALAIKTSTTKFDASVELHINLGVDPRQADQMVRGGVVLPAGTGKSVRVAVIAPADKQPEAKSAGADLVGEDDVIAAIEKGKIDFDVLIATPAVMSKLGKLAKVLGPKGLMPNPKSGTVTANVAEAVKATKAGRVEFRIDKQAIVHQAIGKVSFKPEDLEKNATSFVQAVMDAKPAAAKGTYVKKMTLSTSMGPGIKLNHTQVIASANAAK